MFTYSTQEAKSGVFKTLGDQARQYPGSLFTDQEKVDAQLNTEHYAFPFVCHRHIDKL